MQSSLLNAIGTFNAETQQSDDLKKISGVGPKMEEVLNEIGIYTFLQVSKMTQKEYDLLDSITGSFPGRAERDDWAGQAKKLIN
jgi:molybdopterin-containing oxidoreductase family membrane subunit